MAVALGQSFFSTLPKMQEVPKKQADIAWMIYDLKPPSKKGEYYELYRKHIVYTQFAPALEQITKPKPGAIGDFLRVLQTKVDEKLETPPTNHTVQNPLES